MAGAADTGCAAGAAAALAAVLREAGVFAEVLFLELAGFDTTFFFETGVFFFDAGFLATAAFFLVPVFFVEAFFEVPFLLVARADFPAFLPGERFVTFFRLATVERLAVVFREVFLAVFLVLPVFFFFLAAAFLAGI